jgi:hypothetical protein
VAGRTLRPLAIAWCGGVAILVDVTRWADGALGHSSGSVRSWFARIARSETFQIQVCFTGHTLRATRGACRSVGSSLARHARRGRRTAAQGVHLVADAGE